MKEITKMKVFYASLFVISFLFFSGQQATAQIPPPTPTPTPSEPELNTQAEVQAEAAETNPNTANTPPSFMPATTGFMGGSLFTMPDIFGSPGGLGVGPTE